jgi:4-hydroxythreonine-4-phosphate dehydrogenase
VIREVVITAGDPQGIGPEVARRAALAVASRHPDAGFVLVGDPGMFDDGLPMAEAATRPGLAILPMPFDEPLVEPPPSVAGGKAALAFLGAALERVRTRSGRALVTAPVSKEAIAMGGVPFTGHTGWLRDRCEASRAVMLFVAGTLRVALATVHVPLRAVPDALQIDDLVATLAVVREELNACYSIDRPRIAVLGLNPHAGEGGLLGTEDVDIIAPAVAAACDRGLDVEGPFGADGYFGAMMRAGGPTHDAVLAMYHDQGLLPLKALAFGRAVNVTLGLPIVRTSVDHGCAWSLAGTGEADSGSMEVAVEHALDLVTRVRR